uniref:AF4/FMR2 family, member 3 n=1 Tax=Mus musculus TaxID=10090 RepID=D6RHR2_MOUSE
MNRTGMRYGGKSEKEEVKKHSRTVAALTPVTRSSANPTRRTRGMNSPTGSRIH